MSSDVHAAVALSRVPNIGSKLYRSLLGHFGDPATALRADVRELQRVAGIAAGTARHFAGDLHWREADRILEFCERNGVTARWVGEQGYPTSLADRREAPAVLYQKGEIDLDRARRVAIIGTRRMSALGARQVEDILSQLQVYDPLIISGLAYGVDIAAHRRAVSLGMPTLAVLGSGLGKIYPAAHRHDVQRMCALGGGVLTEYPPWVGPEREHFPARNRIVALLSELVLIVESDVRGGSIITANMAHGYGRKIGACPGRIGDPLTAGCNALIREGRARLVETGQDIADLLGWQRGAGQGAQMGLFEDLGSTERVLVDLLREVPSLAIDELHRNGGMASSDLSATLLGLEIRGIIAAMPGQRYRLMGGRG
jgi:DNA processing protein